MKRIITLFMIIMLLPLYSAAVAEAEMPQVLKADTYIQDICWVGNTLYALGDCTIFSWRPGDADLNVFWQSEESKEFFSSEEKPESEEEQLLWEMAFEDLFTDGTSLYAWQQWSGKLFCLNDGNAVPVITLPVDLLTYEVDGDMRYRQVTKAEMQGNDLLLLLGSDDPENWDNQSLVTVNLQSQEAKVVLSGSINKMIPAGNGNVLLQILDTETGEYVFQLINIANMDSKTEAINLNANCDAIAFWKDQAVICDSGKLIIHNKNQQEETAAYVPVYMSAEISCNTEGLCAVADGRYVFLRDLQKKSEQKVLHIIGLFDKEIIQKFCLLNPESAVVLRSETSDNDATLAALSKSQDTDLFVLSVPGNYTAMMEKGYLSSIDHSALLESYVNSMYSEVRQALISADGKLYGYPVTMRTESWTLDQTGWEKVQLGQVPETYTEIMNLMEKWEEDYSEQWPEYTPIELYGINDFVQKVVKQHILNSNGSYPDFTTPEFRALMKNIIDRKDLFENADVYDACPLIYTYEIGFGISYLDSSKACMVPMPGLTQDDSPLVVGEMEILAINSSSNNKEEAIRFIEFCAEYQNPVTKRKLDPNLNEPMRYTDYDKQKNELTKRLEDIKIKLAEDEENATNELKDLAAEMEKELEKLENDWDISPESIANYRDIAQWLSIPYDSYLVSNTTATEEIYNRIEQFCEEGMPEEKLDAFLNGLNNVCEMAFLEMQ